MGAWSTVRSGYPENWKATAICLVSPAWQWSRSGGSQGDKEPVDSVQYAVSSRRELPPWEALNLVRGHWSIENSLFHVKEDSFREDR
ncbi:MAG: hypothetical protein F4X27_15575 [Chloroflexi bacterium]|nr:hypothetical protein [Chloroflexota bacterium]